MSTSFRHHLTQDTAYETLLGRQRRALHRRVAEALESIYHDQIESQVELLAHHWDRAGEGRMAGAYMADAGRKAAQQHANQEALDYFGQALARTEPGERYDGILRERARVLVDVFRGDEAVRDYAHLLQSARDAGNREHELEALLGLAWAYYWVAADARHSDAVDRSRRLYEEALTLAEALGDKASMVRALTTTQYFIDFWPEYEAQAWANIKRAHALAHEIGDEELIIEANIAMISALAYTDAPARRDRALALIDPLRARHDLPRLNLVYWHLMWAHYWCGDLAECVEICDKGLRLAADIGAKPVMYASIKALALIQLSEFARAWDSLQEEVAGEGDHFGRAMQALGIGALQLELGACEAAADTYKSLLAQARQLRRAWMEESALEGLGLAHIRADQPDQAMLDKIAQELADTTRGPTQRFLAEMSLHAGDPEAALRYAELAHAGAKTRGLRAGEVGALELQMRVLERLGRNAEIVRLADTAIRMAEDMGYRTMLWRVRAARARALEELGRTEEAAIERGTTAAIIWELAATIPDNRLRYGFLSHPDVSSVITGQAGG